MTHPSDGLWNASRYGANARFVSDLGAPVVEMLAPRPCERILDLGCGDGALTARLVEHGCIVVGVDSSEDMVAAARARGIDARLLDGHELPFDGEFDAVFSNAALHWMKAPSRVVAGVWRALRPFGRFVGEMGGCGNVAAIEQALVAAARRRGLEVESPWYFPRPQEYRRLLSACGFDVLHVELFERPTPLPGDIRDWLETMPQPYTAAVPRAERRSFIDEVAERLRPRLCDATGRWTADYVRLRFAAAKSPSGAAS
jgi:trans-aconitate methyltransferase